MDNGYFLFEVVYPSDGVTQFFVVWNESREGARKRLERTIQKFFELAQSSGGYFINLIGPAELWLPDFAGTDREIHYVGDVRREKTLAAT